MFRFVIAALLMTPLLLAADEPKAPVAANPIVNISGRITRVDAFRPGQGMPALVVDADGTSTTVTLGSMRYLMQNDFNPKAGAEIQVKGFKVASGVVAVEVRLPASGTTLKLRDENGWPLWRGGRCRHCGDSDGYGQRGPNPPKR